MDKSQLIADAIDTLRELGVGRDQQNERSAMTLLALDPRHHGLDQRLL